MALRGGECFLVRRVADRGIGKNIGYSRARGDRFNRDRRSAERGNETGNRDPRDSIKIKRLRQRVRDLEEIRRLRQRVRDLELQRERRVKETESENIVWDVVNKEEEHPFSQLHPRLYEPIYQECLSEDQPRYDEDGIEPDEKECAFVEAVLCRIITREDEAMKGTYGKVSVIFDELAVDIVSHVVATGERMGGGLGSETSLMQPNIVEGLNRGNDNVFLNFNKSINDKISRKNNNIISSNMDEHHDFSVYGDYMYLKDKKNNDHQQNGNPREHEGFVDNLLTSNHFNSGKDLENDAGSVGDESNKGDWPYGSSTYDVGPISMSSGHTILEDYQKIEKGNGLLGATSTKLQPKPIVDTQGSRFNAPFDPGGTSLDSVETIYEVGLFGLVVIIINRNRVDVHFDPGGFGLKAKLEDEFFSKRGRMMQGYLQVGI